jgi:hypothetical protein
MMSAARFFFFLEGDAAICRIDFGYEYNHTLFMGSDLLKKKPGVKQVPSGASSRADFLCCDSTIFPRVCF